MSRAEVERLRARAPRDRSGRLLVQLSPGSETFLVGCCARDCGYVVHDGRASCWKGDACDGAVYAKGGDEEDEP